MSLNILYTTQATATGGRNGHTRSRDGLVDVQLSIPKAMGGPGRAGTTTPEDLFAAGYAACFGSACEFVARTLLKLNPGDIAIDCEVAIGQTEDKRFGLQVKLHARIAGLSTTDAQRVVEQAHQVCPYSNATRGNIPVELTASPA
jgi:Ohr subfamily peroxiredoxin